MLAPLLSHCGTVVHLASGTTPGSSAQMPELEQANLLLTRQLVNALQTQPDTHLVFFSSGGTVYGNPASLPVHEDAPLAPLSPHGAAKVVQENLCLSLRVQGHTVSILRPSNAYGPGQRLRGGFGLVRTMLEHARQGTELHIWGDGENVRDYVYVEDLVDATLRLIQQPEVADTYNLGRGVGYSVNQVKAVVEEVTGHPVATRYEPARGVDVRAVVLNRTRAAALLAWRPSVELTEGVAHTWQWLEQSAGSCS
jgi:UDP-glucose 4-epimerase